MIRGGGEAVGASSCCCIALAFHVVLGGGVEILFSCRDWDSLDLIPFLLFRYLLTFLVNVLYGGCCC